MAFTTHDEFPTVASLYGSMVGWTDKPQDDCPDCPDAAHGCQACENSERPAGAWHCFEYDSGDMFHLRLCEECALKFNS